MIIDYIYLILILVLIGSIIFLLYLSYEYRLNEGFTSTPTMNLKTDSIFNLINNINPDNNDYLNFVNNVSNSYNYKQNIDNLKLLENSKNILIQSQKLEDLKNGKSNILSKSKIFPIDKTIQTIKSRYNSQYISTFANDNTKYGILANDKCLTVNGLCKEDYCLLDCQNHLYTTDSQKFNTKRINTATDAADVMNVSVNEISNNVYPFNIFTSAINDKCLTLGNNGITIENCNLNNIKQQWDISPDENICVLK